MNKLVVLLTLGVWIGLVLGLSFIEAPIKFQAPGITTTLGLGIGRLVFGILNKIEITFSLVLLIAHYNLFKNADKFYQLLLSLITIIVLVQTVYLLPVLDDRAELLISGSDIPDSNHHIAYIVIELIKLFSLIILFVKAYKANFLK